MEKKGVNIGNGGKLQRFKPVGDYFVCGCCGRRINCLHHV